MTASGMRLASSGGRTSFTAAGISALGERLPPWTFHDGQLDKAGKPYISHPERVAAILVDRWPDATTAEMQAAWLHDVLEDTEASEAILLNAGISAEAVEIVKMLTRPPGPTYREWISSLAESGHRGAIRVKLADNADNSDPARVAALGDAADMVRKRYVPAKAVLEAGLARADTDKPGASKVQDMRRIAVETVGE